MSKEEELLKELWALVRDTKRWQGENVGNSGKNGATVGNSRENAGENQEKSGKNRETPEWELYQLNEVITFVESKMVPLWREKRDKKRRKVQRRGSAEIGSNVEVPWLQANTNLQAKIPLEGEVEGVNAHSESVDAHTEKVDAHTESVDAHSEGVNAHSVSVDAHTEKVDAHSEGVDAHSVSVDAHSHRHFEDVCENDDFLRRRCRECFASRDFHERTILHLAADAGNSRLVRELCRMLGDGRPLCEVHTPARDGMQAIHFAANKGHTQTVKELILAGAKVNAATQRGSKTPLQLARQRNHTDLVDFLLSKGGRLRESMEKDAEFQKFLKQQEIAEARESPATETETAKETETARETETGRQEDGQ